MTKFFAHALSCGLCIFSLCFASLASASPHIADFSLDLSREDLLLRKVSEQGGRYSGEVDLGGVSWKGSFAMEGGKLSAIALSGPATKEYMQAATEAFASSPYVVHSALADCGSFDFTRQNGESFSAFLRRAGGAGCSFLSITYIDRAGFERLSGKPGLQNRDSVGCALALDGAGITIIMMKFDDLRQEMNSRMALRSGPQLAAGDNYAD